MHAVAFVLLEKSLYLAEFKNVMSPRLALTNVLIPLTLIFL